MDDGSWFGIGALSWLFFVFCHLGAHFLAIIGSAKASLPYLTRKNLYVPVKGFRRLGLHTTPWSVAEKPAEMIQIYARSLHTPRNTERRAPNTIPQAVLPLKSHCSPMTAGIHVPSALASVLYKLVVILLLRSTNRPAPVPVDLPWPNYPSICECVPGDKWRRSFVRGATARFTIVARSSSSSRVRRAPPVTNISRRIPGGWRNA